MVSGAAGLAVLLAVVLLAACGGGDERAAAPPAELPAPTEGAPPPMESAPTGGEQAADREDGEANSEAGGGGAACVFHAPPGRLAEDAIAIELSDVPCEQGMRLAEAAAVGQPAGANLTVSRDGFECEPSSAEKGANVTYTCAGDAGEVTFDVAWTAAG